MMPSLTRNGQFRGLAGIAFLSLVCAAPAAQTAIITHRYDNYRTGWNSTETVLTPTNVNASQFGILSTVAGDDQVGSQPPGLLPAGAKKK